MAVPRRSVLAAASLGLASLGAGCSGFPSRLLGSGPGRVVSLHDVDAVGAAHPFRFDVDLGARRLASESMPAIEIGLESTASSELYLGYTGRWPAGGLLRTRDSDPSGLRLLAAAEASSLTIDEGSCPATAFQPIGEAPPAGHLVEPDRQYRATFRVLGSDDAVEEGCPPGGRYRWESTYRYAAAADVRALGWTDTEPSSFEWGFTLELKGAEAV